MHQLGLRTLEGFFNYGMSLVFIFSCATNQAKVLILAFDYYKNLVGWKETEYDILNKAKKKDLLTISLKRIVSMLSHLGGMETSVCG